MMAIYGKNYAIRKSVETIQDALKNMEKERDVLINIDASDDIHGNPSIDGT